jgi:flavin-dependent dehydrogenase
LQVCVGLVSDRAAKANFGTVDPADMLDRVRSLPITTWNYRSDDASVRHIGPMAQDFTAVFGVGSDDRTIHPMDGQGVALAAIQGLAAQVAALQAEQQSLLEQVAALKARCGREDPA